LDVSILLAGEDPFKTGEEVVVFAEELKIKDLQLGLICLLHQIFHESDEGLTNGEIWVLIRTVFNANHQPHFGVGYFLV
jgi:hypothetical protein